MHQCILVYLPQQEEEKSLLLLGPQDFTKGTFKFFALTSKLKGNLQPSRAPYGKKATEFTSLPWDFLLRA